MLLRVFRNVIYNYWTYKKPQLILGRWCHPGYSNKCDPYVKSNLANIDNSSAHTGLCNYNKYKL